MIKQSPHLLSISANNCSILVKNGFSGAKGIGTLSVVRISILNPDCLIKFFNEMGENALICPEEFSEPASTPKSCFPSSK